MDKDKNVQATPGSVVVEEEWYDLLPIEKKLIISSLSLGLALLVVFVFAFGALHH